MYIALNSCFTRREGMLDETLLHSQLQEGLLYNLMKAPAVSGPHAYREQLGMRRRGW